MQIKIWSLTLLDKSRTAAGTAARKGLKAHWQMALLQRGIVLVALD